MLARHAAALREADDGHAAIVALFQTQAGRGCVRKDRRAMVLLPDLGVVEAAGWAATGGRRPLPRRIA